MDGNKQLLQTHKQSFLLWIALALGLFAQWLFIGRPLGISWLIFVVVLLLALCWNGRRAELHAARRNLWLWPALLFFAAMVFLRANPFLTFLNIVTTLLLLAYITYFYAAGAVSQLSLSGILILPARMAGLSLLNLEPVLALGLAPAAGKERRQREWTPVLRGAALALPVLVVFTLLLASADLVFSAHLQRLVALDMDEVWPIIVRVLFVALIGGLVAGSTATAVLRGLRSSEDDHSWVERLVQDLPRRFSLGAVETGTILLLVSALFFIFVLLQATYLFGGEANISREGFTYAEYARRGFSELVLVASLSLALILTLNWLTRRESKRQIKWFNLFSSLLIGLVLLILATAFWRMRLYEQAYGYTELRLMVLVFEGWLALLLIWFLITLWRAPELFALGCLIAALGFAATLNLINPHALIVRHNLQRYQTAGDLDMAYLTRLSADAVPLLVEVLDEVEGDEELFYSPSCYDDECQVTMSVMLEEELQRRYEDMNEDQGWLALPSYHQSRFQANRALACWRAPEAASVRIGLLQITCDS